MNGIVGGLSLELVAPVGLPPPSRDGGRGSSRVDVHLGPESVRQLVVDGLGHVVVAPVHEIGP